EVLWMCYRRQHIHSTSNYVRSAAGDEDTGEEGDLKSYKNHTINIEGEYVDASQFKRVNGDA
ncbi:MAG TPA: hypothetical protein VFK47_06510, partial [Ktedonobacteraceae bacterium]|nr:hypothetical protein [Ktedonobacteraceae bacterium]